MRSLAVILVSLLLAGCDTMYGIYRRAPVPTVPDMAAIKARIESYPEIEKVEFKQFDSGARPITLTGLKKEDEIYQIHYFGGDSVRGYLVFERDYKGRVTYRQYLTSMNRRVPQEWVDATWPVMKKIEADLIFLFGLSGITEKLEAGYHGGEDPERRPNQALEPTATAVTNRAAHASRQP
jgi:hypothetical protein